MTTDDGPPPPSFVVSGPRLPRTMSLPSRVRHVEARHRLERGRAHGGASAEGKRCVVPGAAHLVADDEALAERPAVVRALGADREDFVAAPN